MDFKKIILTMLAIFCVVVSAAAVCATDVADDGGYAGSQYPEGYDGGYAGSNYQDDGGWAGSQYNETEMAQMGNATGEPTNQTVNATQPTATATSPAVENTTAAHTLPSTGNPIVMLIGVTALIGGCAVLRKK